MPIFIYKTIFFKKQSHFPMKPRKTELELALHIACRSLSTAIKMNSFIKTASRGGVLALQLFDTSYKTIIQTIAKPVITFPRLIFDFMNLALRASFAELSVDTCKCFLSKKSSSVPLQSDSTVSLASKVTGIWGLKH